MDWGRNAVQSREIDPCPSDVGVEAMQPSHLVDPKRRKIVVFYSNHVKFFLSNQSKLKHVKNSKINCKKLYRKLLKFEWLGGN